MLIDPIKAFTTENYKTINRTRMAHLASLGLDLDGKTVLELGAGVGDLTEFFVDRNCQITSIEGRPENLSILQKRFPNVKHILADLENPPPLPKFDIVFAYGILYHVRNPQRFLEYVSEQTSDLLLIETIVTPDSNEQINVVHEHTYDPTQSISGKGCRPTRQWIFSELSKSFEHVYIPKTQPNYPILYPLDWKQYLGPQLPGVKPPVTRTGIIASRQVLDNQDLCDYIPMEQTYAK